ncbi:Smr/MutS family protein [Sulfitobacter donghicola]|uniref:DNA mismatch repair protein MutS n=1 Tax=Sulfitobacter donghicola DSW-25 = KCTC 12864 = JCM 14565 TaxID=1300350 RepID=A0A073IZ19_9RHOB|nr:Smr/MutS family protein [Sulfitobacter donghicola]KEJ90637.1 DNA mismatch repair protein MutS [Sulfitobacter donghicola DSW-25 = KCTC 12864 = JCM 14565]KIN67886.1 Smr domain protein [Sulfitobacter donghicola DSW-25 = KCTC 12864 = JCM 14565]
MKRRGLTAEDQELWDRIRANTERLERSNLEVKRFDEEISQTAPEPGNIRKAKSVILGKPSGKARAAGHDLAPAIHDHIRKSPVQMDNKSFGKLKRGKMRPEGKIDLHGMTLERAHPALLSFVMRSHAQGKRLILVVTGKGKQRDDGGPIPVRLGVLRHQVPQWLAMQPMKSVVLQIAQAHVSHGGGGAYYVYLRRHR